MASEDEYSVLPMRPKNYGDALKLLEEEMAKEYGDGQPFIDPGSQAYEQMDYDGQLDNESNEDPVPNDSRQQQILSPSQQQAIGEIKNMNKVKYFDFLVTFWSRQTAGIYVARLLWNEKSHKLKNMLLLHDNALDRIRHRS